MSKFLKDILYSYQKGEHFCCCYFKMGKDLHFLGNCTANLNFIKTFYRVVIYYYDLKQLKETVVMSNSANTTNCLNSFSSYNVILLK